MSFEVFGAAQKDSIRVGYISPELGYVDGVTIYEANQYAQKNPGTVFIFKTRNFIRFLNINEVNKLTPEDLLGGDECNGIEVEKECGPPQVFFYGGGGVGVQANPIIGEDGSLLAVDLVSGGFGYQYPPLVEIKDGCGIGAGSVVKAILGEQVESVVYYDQEDDFEIYDFGLAPEEDGGYGLRYAPDGSVLGVWEPTLYANFSTDPILREIQEYQDFLQNLQKPWWTTRKEVPLLSTSGEKISRTKFDVTDKTFVESQLSDGSPNPLRWSDFMNKYAISPVSPSNVKGTDYAGIPFTLEWEEDFPYDGEYIFRGHCDNKAELYLDNIKLDDLRVFDEAPPKAIKKNIKAGVHRIRLDLLNFPLTQSSTTKQKTNIFNTIDYINKANRQLWRTNVYGRGGFINEYGVCPFDTTVQLEDNPYAGTHRIVWDNIDFPSDGNYVIEVEVDDNVTLIFSNSNSETTIVKNGFSGEERSTGKSTETRFFKAGKYKLTANLEQIPGGRFGFSNTKGINPMALAVRVTSTITLDNTVSANSWNQNPMGVALTIDAPNPPIPQEPIPVQEGRCPNNPIWTTRFPNAENKWYPVNLGSRWSKFMNRYAMSPIPPLSTEGSDGSGVVYKNSWDLDIPYDGFYALRGTRDNFGRILIDGKEVSTLNGFKTQNPDYTKIFLSKGQHKIDVEIENEKANTFVEIDKKIFDTKDWIGSPNNQNYSGPLLASYRNGDLGPLLTPAFKDDNDYRANNMGRTWILRWTNVDFPETGQYELKAEADDELIVRIDGVEVGRARVFFGVSSVSFNATQGVKTIEMELSNIPGNASSNFETNPVVFNAVITKKVNVFGGTGKSWTSNPIGISAVLIPPPCPKIVKGKGVVTDVQIDDPGNSYASPSSPTPSDTTPTYPVSLRLKDVSILDPGINYGPNDQILIEPSNGAVLSYDIGPFGKITNVNILDPGLGFTTYPNIRIVSDTGINATLAPQFEVVRDPIVIDENKLIQVTDLVGLKQTGYVDGRAYYGSVFYKDGVRYAGFYETVGDLVQVYDTLQESIDAQVTTVPSAIQRQGTDVSSNDPRLNIPGTPGEII